MSRILVGGIVAALAAFLTSVLTPLVRSLAISGGLVRGVQPDRWHRRATPAVGGVAIFAGFGVAVAVGYALDPSSLAELTGSAPRAVLALSPWQGLALASALAFAVGLVDDLARLPPIAKLSGQVAAAAVLVLSGVGVWLTGWYPADAALSLFWFVGITNALNLLDNMDGLAAGVAAVAATYLSLLFFLEGAVGLGIVALAFVAALAGFLVHNYPPARIFMGDSGSLFLGLFLAGLALAPVPGLSRSLASVLAAPVLILGVPILDTTLVTIGRFLEGRPISQGGKDHTSHRFVALGLSEERTLWLLWSLAGVGGMAGLLLRSAERGTALLVGGLVVGSLALVGAYLLTVRLRSIEGVDEGRLTLYRFLVQGQRRYPIFALLMDAVWIVVAYYGAYLLRWDTSQLAAELPYFQRTVVVWLVAKVVAFVAAGVYGSPFTTFGLFDGVRVVRGNVVATLLGAGTLFLIERNGLSRGVLALDFMLLTSLTLASRATFRLLDEGMRRWSVGGRRALLIVEAGHAELAVRQLERLGGDLTVTGVVDPDGVGGSWIRGARRTWAGEEGLARALGETGATVVIVVEDAPSASRARDMLARHLGERGGLDAYSLRVHLDPLVLTDGAP